ncbi:MAG TPA: hypothetical protein VFW89_09670 [Gemmatimonadaceae bacterium]|nr:hypothetical protein [Gemmatimonadaceae bacterium]
MSEAGGANDLLAVIDAVVTVFEREGIRYFVTGSFASSMHGEFRATNDLDIVATLDPPHLASALRALSHDFIVDVDQARAAIEAGSSFNLIHRIAYMKVDIFPSISGFDAEQTRRAETVSLPGIAGPFRVATKEDVLLAKLRWYRLGGETSEVQRRDIHRLIELNTGSFDNDYVQAWARQLAVSDLLERFRGYP